MAERRGPDFHQRAVGPSADVYRGEGKKERVGVEQKKNNGKEEKK